MNIRKILASILSIGVVALVAVVATRAFFSDTETSTGNLFQAGAIDLLVDNESYVTNSEGVLVASEDTSWDLRNLTIEKFFNFSDIKPGDIGEDTISLHVNNNDAYLCAAASITEDSDVDYTEPELADDNTVHNPVTAFDGELGSQLNFAFWADDGDNVYENGEQIFLQGPISGLNNAGQIALADSSTNVWNSSQAEGPVTGGLTYHIGKAWCFGSLTEAQVAQNSDTGPLDRGTGFNCDGTAVNNAAQTDRVLGDMQFYAVQSRNNGDFQCSSVDLGSTTEVLYQDLENKDGGFDVIEDEIYGTIAYSSGAENFYGVVQGQGLESDSKYQITLNGPGTCTTTDDNLATFGSNLFQSGYWNNWAPNLSNTCTGSPGEGVYNMNLQSDWYTFVSDGEGNFVYPFNLALPAGSYSGVKVLVKKMKDVYESPWVDSDYEHVNNLFETAAINFTVN